MTAGPPVAASTWTLKSSPLLKALDMLHLLGVSGVELWAQGAHLDPRGPLPDLEQVGAALDRLGLWPQGMHAPFRRLDLTVADDGRRREHVAVLKQALDAAAALDCLRVVVHVDGAGEETAAEGGGSGSRRARLARAKESLTALCTYAMARGVTVLVENQPDRTGARIGARVEELVSLIEAVDMPNLGLCFDLAHAIVSTGSWEEEWRAGVEHVASVHASDTFGRDDDHLPLGAGSVDWVRVVEVLAAGPEGVDVVLEVAGGEAAVRDSLAAWDRAVAAAG